MGKGVVVLALLWASASDGLAAAASGNSAYELIVAPIFRARCVECHGEEKQKAKLALHTWESAAKGSDAGAIWVAGKPAESSLIQRLRLPLDDEEHMPPKDHPQPAPEEIALLTRWVERGASREAKLADLQLSAELVRAAEELPAKLAVVANSSAHADPVWEFDPAAVAKARAPLAGKVAELQKRYPGALTYESRTSAALQFTAAGIGPTFSDDDLARLAPLADALVLLDVSSTAVTDRSATVLAGFANLRVLRLGATSVGDATALALARLAKLESLVLHGTRVTPVSIAALAKLPAIRRVHLGGTAAVEAARESKLPLVENVELE